MATAKKKTKKKTTKKVAAKKTEVIDTSTGEITSADPVAEAEQPMVASGAATMQQVPMSPEFEKFEIAKRIAQSLAQSNLVPDAYRGRPNDCFIAINMGAELGMEPFQAIQSIAVIDGKPSIYGDGLIGLVRGSGKAEYIKEWLSEDGNTAFCETKRKGESEPVRAQYSMGDAMLAGIDSRRNWKKHPKRMLQMRARAYCLRDAYADVLKGLAAADEMYDHEDTPRPIRDFDLGDEPKTEKQKLLAEAQEVFGEGVTEITLESVQKEMVAATSMEELLKTINKASALGEEDIKAARITYGQQKARLKAQS